MLGGRPRPDAAIADSPGSRAAAQLTTDEVMFNGLKGVDRLRWKRM